MGCSNSHADHAALTVNYNATKDFHDVWEVHEQLRDGHFIKVYKVKEKGSSRSAVAKIFDMREGDEDASVQKMNTLTFKAAVHEARMQSMVGQHKHLVSLYGIFRSNHTYHMVMEACTCPVSSHLARLPGANEKDLADVFEQMLSALAHIHSRSIAHRDIRPDAFLLGEGGLANVKLCDFAQAAVVPESGCLTESVGAAPYMSPEMLNFKGYDTKTDVWSLGVVCYLMLYGKFPYMSSEGSLDAVRQAIASGVPSPNFQASRSMQTTFLAKSFVSKLLDREASSRVDARQALKDQFFKVLVYNNCDLQPILQMGEQLQLEFAEKENERYAPEEEDAEYDTEIPWCDDIVLLKDSLAHRMMSRKDLSPDGKLNCGNSLASESTCADSVAGDDISTPLYCSQTSSKFTAKLAYEIPQSVDCGLDLEYGLDF